jgi:hypothetical protein
MWGPMFNLQHQKKEQIFIKHQLCAKNCYMHTYLISFHHHNNCTQHTHAFIITTTIIIHLIVCARKPKYTGGQVNCLTSHTVRNKKSFLSLSRILLSDCDLNTPSFSPLLNWDLSPHIELKPASVSSMPIITWRRWVYSDPWYLFKLLINFLTSDSKSSLCCCCSFIHMCIHCLGHFSPLPPSPPLSSRQVLFCPYH